MEIKEKIEIQKGPYANLILSHNYQKWVTLNNQGIFPLIPPWQKRWSWVGQRLFYLYWGKKEQKGQGYIARNNTRN